MDSEEMVTPSKGATSQPMLGRQYFLDRLSNRDRHLNPPEGHLSRRKIRCLLSRLTIFHYKTYFSSIVEIPAMRSLFFASFSERLRPENSEMIYIVDVSNCLLDFLNINVSAIRASQEFKNRVAELINGFRSTKWVLDSVPDKNVD